MSKSINYIRFNNFYELIAIKQLLISTCTEAFGRSRLFGAPPDFEYRHPACLPLRNGLDPATSLSDISHLTSGIRVRARPVSSVITSDPTRTADKPSPRFIHSRALTVSRVLTDFYGFPIFYIVQPVTPVFSRKKENPIHSGN